MKKTFAALTMMAVLLTGVSSSHAGSSGPGQPGYGGSIDEFDGKTERLLKKGKRPAAWGRTVDGMEVGRPPVNPLLDLCQVAGRIYKQRIGQLNEKYSECFRLEDLSEDFADELSECRAEASLLHDDAESALGRLCEQCHLTKESCIAIRQSWWS